MRHTDFTYTGVSFAGNTHVQHRRNNQDYWVIDQREARTVIVVTDGCGSCERSEYGACFGAQVFASRAHMLLDAHQGNLTDFEWHTLLLAYLGAVEQHVRGELGIPPERFTRFLESHFLHTAAIAVIDDEYASFVRFGDCYINVNGLAEPSGKFAGNAPPFPVFWLINPERCEQLYRPHHMCLMLDRAVPVTNLQHFVIGSDGTNDLARSASKLIPGDEERVGPISQFWRNPLYRDPDQLAMRVGLIGKPYVGGGTVAPGLLHDDTTFVVGVHTPKEQ